MANNENGKQLVQQIRDKLLLSIVVVVAVVLVVLIYFKDDCEWKLVRGETAYGFYWNDCSGEIYYVTGSEMRPIVPEN